MTSLIVVPFSTLIEAINSFASKEVMASIKIENGTTNKEGIANAAVTTDVKQVIDAPAPPSVPDAKKVIDAENDVEVEIHGPLIKPFHGAHVYFLGFEPSDFEVMATGEYFPK